MSDLCRNALRLFVFNPSAGDAALDLSKTLGPLRSQAAEQMIQQLKACDYSSSIQLLRI